MRASSRTDTLGDAARRADAKDWHGAAKLFESVWAFLDPTDKTGHIAQFAKALRKSGEASTALDLFEEIYGGKPNRRWEKQEYLWCLYSAKVQTWDDDLDLEAASEIVRSSSPTDKYSPFNFTVLRVARSLTRGQQYKEVIEWCSLTRFKFLDDEAYYDKEKERWYRSSRLKYFSLMSNALFQEEKYEGCILCCLDAFDHCFLGNRSRTLAWYTGPIWQFYTLLILASAAAKGLEGRKHITSLLNRNGFEAGAVRSRYAAALLGDLRSSPDWDCLWDRYGSKEDSSRSPIPDSSAIRRVAEAVRSLESERRIRESGGAERRRRRSSKVTASEISDYVFCPASLAIKQTYQTGETEPMELGTKMHEEGLLEAKRRFRGLGDMNRSQRDPLNYLKKHIPPGHIQTHRTVLLDIAQSKVVFADRPDQRQKPYRNEDLDFEGVPDYVFERRDGVRFVVEEKFRSGLEVSKGLDRPFSNHHAQLASYVHLLDSVGAAYGYLVYWYHALPDNATERDDSPTENATTLAGCEIFRVAVAPKVETRLRVLVDEVRSIKSGEPAAFDALSIRANKCMKCSVNKLCSHKTGRMSSISVPYETTNFA